MTTIGEAGNEWTAVSKKFTVAVYPFERSSNTAYLTLSIGDEVIVTHQFGGWYKGYLYNKIDTNGIFPVSLVHEKACIVENEGTDEEVIILDEDPLLQEAANCLRYWGVAWQKLFIINDVKRFQECAEIMKSLISDRTNLLKATIPYNQKLILKKKMINDMEDGTQTFGLQVVSRDSNGKALDNLKIGFADLYLSMHKKFDTHGDNLASIDINTYNDQHNTIAGNFHHLFFSLLTVVLRLLFDTELFVSIYDGTNKKRITEQLRVCMDRGGVPKNSERVLKTYAVFTDLESKDIKHDLYLLVEMIRFGPFEAKEAEHIHHYTPNAGAHRKGALKKQVYVRRPFAIGMYPLKDIFSTEQCHDNDENQDLLVTMYQCIETKDSEYTNLPEHIIAGNETIVSPLGPRGSGVYMNLKALHGVLHEVNDANSYLFTKETTILKTVKFPEIILPETERNDVYIRLKTGVFPKYNKKSDKNVEVQVRLRKKDGKIIESCILPGIGEASLTNYFSTVYYHNGRPPWNDSFKISLATSDYSNAMIEFLFRHRSKNEKDERPFSMCFLRLMKADGTLITDGEHELMMYKASTLPQKDEPPKYLKSEFKDEKLKQTLSREELKVLKDYLVTKESMFVEVTTTSTRLTKNINILNILLWQNHQKILPLIMASVKDIPDEDMIVFLDELLHALFGILNEGEEFHHAHTLGALINILALPLERRHPHFKRNVDNFCQKNFYCTKAYVAMLKQAKAFLTKIIQDEPIEEFEQIALKKFFKAIGYFIKFTIKSWKLQEQANKTEDISPFHNNMLELLDLFVDLMREDRQDILPIVQGLAMQNFPCAFPDLISILPSVELAKRISYFISVGRDNNFVRARIIFILHLVRSPLMQHDEARKEIFPTVICQVKKYLQNPSMGMKNTSQVKQNLQFTILVMFSLYNLIYGKDGFNEEVKLLTKEILPILAHTFCDIQFMDEPKLKVHLISSLVGLIDCVKEEQLGEYMSPQNFPSVDELEEFMKEIFSVCFALLEQNIYAENWMVVQLRKDSVVLKTITYVIDALNIHTLNITQELDFNFELWTSFFKLGMQFCLQPALQLENQDSFYQKDVLERYGDMRIGMAQLLIDKWNDLGEFQQSFTYFLTEYFLTTALLPPMQLRTMVIPVFFDMMVNSYERYNNFFSLEATMIDHLDTCISARGMGDSEFRKQFNDILIELFDDHEYKTQGIKFVSNLSDLLSRLIDFRTVEQQFEASDVKMKAMSNLLNYYKEMGRNEMYIRYIYRFCDMLEKKQYYAEAAFILLLHADVLQWRLTPMKPEGKYPAQNESERKAALYDDIIDFLNKGKMWEIGIEQCKKLADYFVTEAFDYKKLSEIYAKISEFYSKIISEIRAASEYFRVGFYGKGFPNFLQNQVFIYRGLEYEGLGSFNDRLAAEFSNAKFMKTLVTPEEDILESKDQYIQSCKVDPINQSNHIPENVSDLIKNFYRTNNVSSFQLSRPFHKGQKDKLNEFKTLWLERTTYKTGIPFPGILRSFPVVDTIVKEISPLEFAIETISSSTRDLQELINSLKEGFTSSINPLSMKLNGMIDAAVMGGLRNYEEAFFTEDYLTDHPDHTDKVIQLKELIYDQIIVIQVGLKLHGKLCGEALLQLHQKMEGLFPSLKNKYQSDVVRRGYRIDSVASDSLTLSVIEQPIRIRTNSYVAKKSYTLKPNSNFAKRSQYSKAISVTGSLTPISKHSKISVGSVSEEDQVQYRTSSGSSNQEMSVVSLPVIKLTHSTIRQPNLESLTKEQSNQVILENSTNHN